MTTHWGWAYVEGDDLVHVAHYSGGTLLCEQGLPWRERRRPSKVVITCVAGGGTPAQPRIVTCQGCLDAGAVNHVEPEGGWSASWYDCHVVLPSSARSG